MHVNTHLDTRPEIDNGNLYFLRQDLSLHLEPINSVRVADQRLLRIDPFVSASPALRMQASATTHGFFHASTRNPNSGPHVYVASIANWEPKPLTAELLLQSYSCLFHLLPCLIVSIRLQAAHPTGIEKVRFLADLFLVSTKSRRLLHVSFWIQKDH